MLIPGSLHCGLFLSHKLLRIQVHQPQHNLTGSGAQVGSKNHHNVLRATVEGLKTLRSPEDVAAVRGKDAETLRQEAQG